MSEKSTLIAAICEINPSASTEWLACFSEQDLAEYLKHHAISMEPASATRWIRRNDRAPMITREAA